MIILGCPGSTSSSMDGRSSGLAEKQQLEIKKDDDDKSCDNEEEDDWDEEEEDSSGSELWLCEDEARDLLGRFYRSVCVGTSTHALLCAFRDVFPSSLQACISMQYIELVEQFKKPFFLGVASRLVRRIVAAGRAAERAAGLPLSVAGAMSPRIFLVSSLLHAAARTAVLPPSKQGTDRE